MVLNQILNRILNTASKSPVAAAAMPALSNNFRSIVIDPDIVAKYKHLDDSSPEKFFAMMTGEQHFRHNYETERLKTFNRIALCGLIAAVLMCATTILLAFMFFLPFH